MSDSKVCKPVSIRSLSPADAQALDELLSAPGSPQGLGANAEEQARRQRVAALLARIQRWPAAEPPADLTARTARRVAEVRWRQRYLEQARDMRGPGASFSWRDLLTAAAVFLIAVGVLWPALERSRAEARQTACAQNLATAGRAVGQYAVANRGVLPRLAVPENRPASWWKVGQAGEGGACESNSAHLYLLVRQRYVQFRVLSCPENPAAPQRLGPKATDWPSFAAVSYSYQNQYGQPVRVERWPGMAVLADKNPLFATNAPGGSGLTYNVRLSPNSPSQAHRGRGQNILTAGGAVVWSAQPILAKGNDNIWLANGKTSYTGSEVPSSPDDSFLVP